jgi:hypothetical protein
MATSFTEVRMPESWVAKVMEATSPGREASGG